MPLKTMRAIEIELFVKASRDSAGHAVREAGVLPRAGADRREGVLPAEVGPRRAEQERHLQDRAQGPRAAGRAQPVRQDDAADHAALARRGPRDRRAEPSRGRDRDQGLREEDGGAARRQHDRRVRRGRLRRRLSPGPHGRHREEGRRREAGAAGPRRADEHHRPDGRARGIGRPPRDPTGPPAKTEAPAKAAAKPKRAPKKAAAKAPRRRSPASAVARRPDVDGVVPGEQLGLPIEAPAAAPERLPARIAPMQPTTGAAPFDDPAYLFEPWWPGVRAAGLGRRPVG